MLIEAGKAVAEAYKPQAEGAAKRGNAAGGKKRKRGQPVDKSGDPAPQTKRDESARTSSVAAAAAGMGRKTFEAIQKIEDPAVAADNLAKAEMMAGYAKRIKATDEEVNSVQDGKLMLAAKVGELCPAPTPQESGSRGGRGKKGDGATDTLFHRETLANYRKLVAYQKRGKIDADWDDVVENDHVQEVSLAGFY